MARSKRRRVTSVNARADALPVYIPNPYDMSRQMAFGFLRSVEDRREWHPEGPQRPARSRSRAFHRLVLAQPAARPKAGVDVRAGVDSRIAFSRGTMICERRKRRREVLHAIGKTGSGQKRQKRPVWNYYSSISCRKGRR